MAGFTLFPAETRVKLTLRPRAAMIAPMRSRVACVAVIGLVAAAGCNEGLSPTPACPRGFVGICGTATVRGTLPALEARAAGCPRDDAAPRAECAGDRRPLRLYAGQFGPAATRDCPSR